LGKLRAGQDDVGGAQPAIQREIARDAAALGRLEDLLERRAHISIGGAQACVCNRQVLLEGFHFADRAGGMRCLLRARPPTHRASAVFGPARNRNGMARQSP
jgi:hypothetical protein